MSTSSSTTTPSSNFPSTTSTTTTTTTTTAPSSTSKYPSYFPILYTFPPFYTRQPNEQTWSVQLGYWRQFVLDFCKNKKIWRLHLHDALETELFKNDELRRQLNLETAREVIESLVKSGNAEWMGTDKTIAAIYWRTPEDWAALIMEWIDNTGQKNQVLTLYEIMEGDATQAEEFHGMDEKILRKSLDVLVKKQQAQVFSVGDEAGVKFF